MGRLFARVWRLGAAVLLLAVVLAPVVLVPVGDALTHGPGTMAAALDHAAHHAEQGPLGHTFGHAPHDAADHDHSVSVLLPATPALAMPQGKDLWPALCPHFAGIGAQGPRRPPRGACLTA